MTLGFGEIIRVFLNNMEQPLNITNGPAASGRSTACDLGIISAGLGKT